MLIERVPLTLTVVIKRAIGDTWHEGIRDTWLDILTFWLTFWHVWTSHPLWVWWYDFRKGCQSRSVTVKNWKTSYLLAGLTYDNCSLKKEIGLLTAGKKSLEGTLSFSNWVLNIKQKSNGYCFIFKPSLYYICIKIILFCLWSQYLSSRSVTHDKSRA